MLGRQPPCLVASGRSTIARYVLGLTLRHLSSIDSARPAASPNAPAGTSRRRYARAALRTAEEDEEAGLFLGDHVGQPADLRYRQNWKDPDRVVQPSASAGAGEERRWTSKRAQMTRESLEMLDPDGSAVIESSTVRRLPLYSAVVSGHPSSSRYGHSVPSKLTTTAPHLGGLPLSYSPPLVSSNPGDKLLTKAEVTVSSTKRTESPRSDPVFVEHPEARYSALFSARQPLKKGQAQHLMRHLRRQSPWTIFQVLETIPCDVTTDSQQGVYAWRILRLYVSKITTDWTKLTDTQLTERARLLLGIIIRFGIQMSPDSVWRAKQVVGHVTVQARARRDQTWQGLWAIFFEAIKTLDRRKLLRMSSPVSTPPQEGGEMVGPTRPMEAATSTRHPFPNVGGLRFPPSLADTLFHTFARPKEGRQTFRSRDIHIKPEVEHTPGPGHTEHHPVPPLNLATTLEVYNELQITPTARQLALILQIYASPSLFHLQSDKDREALWAPQAVAQLIARAKLTWAGRQALAESVETVFTNLPIADRTVTLERLGQSRRVPPPLALDPSDHSITPKETHSISTSKQIGALRTPTYTHLTEALLVNWLVRDWERRSGPSGGKGTVLSPSDEAELRRIIGWWTDRHTQAVSTAHEKLDGLVRRWNSAIAQAGAGQDGESGFEGGHAGEHGELRPRVIRPDREERFVLEQMIKAALVRVAGDGNSGGLAEVAEGPGNARQGKALLSRRGDPDRPANRGWPRPIDLEDYTVVELLQLLRGLEVVPSFATSGGLGAAQSDLCHDENADKDGPATPATTGMDTPERMSFESLLFRVRNTMLHEGSFWDTLELVEMLQPGSWPHPNPTATPASSVGAAPHSAVQLDPNPSADPVSTIDHRTGRQVAALSGQPIGHATTPAPRLRLAPLAPLPGAFFASVLGTVHRPSHLSILLSRLLTLPVPANPARMRKQLRHRLQGLLLSLRGSEPSFDLSEDQVVPAGQVERKVASYGSKLRAHSAIQDAYDWLEEHGDHSVKAFFARASLPPSPSSSSPLLSFDADVSSSGTIVDPLPGSTFIPYSASPSHLRQSHTSDHHPSLIPRTPPSSSTAPRLPTTPWTRLWRAGVERWGVEVVKADDRIWRGAYVGLLRARQMLSDLNVKDHECLSSAATDRRVQAETEADRLLAAWSIVRRDKLSDKAVTSGWKRRPFKKKVGAVKVSAEMRRLHKERAVVASHTVSPIA